MIPWLLFVVLPIVLIVLSFRIRPAGATADPLGAGLAARGLFGGHDLHPDERTVPEDDAPRPFRLE
ncbi:hypothetical protein [Deinococcus sonorensis]|uniref:Uncharacterized protein n=2 Tax=Deinococcus sonorensis TaxID=309891 RepID=A0AAU7U700_9DEIO